MNKLHHPALPSLAQMFVELAVESKGKGTKKKGQRRDGRSVVRTLVGGGWRKGRHPGLRGWGRRRKAPQNLDPRRDAYKKLSGYVGWLQGTIVVELFSMLALVVKGTCLQLKVNSNHLDSFLRSHNSFCTVNNSKQAFLIPPKK